MCWLTMQLFRLIPIQLMIAIHPSVKTRFIASLQMVYLSFQIGITMRLFRLTMPIHQSKIGFHTQLEVDCHPPHQLSLASEFRH